MKIELKKIVYKNILSVGNKPVTMILNKHHTTMITGKNGASKSTLSEAIMFALFGKPYRDINKPLLVNSINRKQLLVELWFSVGKKEYYIKRGIKPNVFLIEEDGVLLDEEDASVRDLQKYLENNILKTNYKTAKQVVALGTAGFKPFMQLRTHERRAIVEDLLDIEVFSKMVEKNKLIQDDLTNEIREHTDTITILEKESQMRLQLLKEANKDNTNSILEFKNKIIECNDKIDIINKKLEASKKKYKELTGGIEPFDKKELQDSISKKSVLESELSNIRKGITFFEHNKKCPTCKQHIDDEWIDTKLTQYYDEASSTQTLIDKEFEKISKLQLIETNNKKLKKDIEEVKNSVISDKIYLEGQTKYIKQYEDEIVKLETKNKSPDKTRLKEIIIELKKVQELKDTVVNERYCHSVVANVLKDNGVKSRIISQYIPVINHLINTNLKTMDANYVFELDSEFNETVKSRGREDFSYNSFSQGEKMRIDLAILFTWRELLKLKNSASFNVLIMDEIMDSAADQDGVDLILGIIRTLKDNVFIISHDEKIDPSMFNRHIQMVKQGNFSQIASNV